MEDLRGHADDCKFDRELAAVGMQCGHFDSFAEDRTFAGGSVMRQSLAMALTKWSRDDELGKLLPDGFGTAVAKHLFGCRVELNHSTRAVHHDDRVEGQFDNGAFACFALSCLVPRLPLFVHFMQSLRASSLFFSVCALAWPAFKLCR